MIVKRKEASFMVIDWKLVGISLDPHLYHSSVVPDYCAMDNLTGVGVVVVVAGNILLCYFGDEFTLFVSLS